MSREMKDSGIAWIGQLPKTWETAAIKRSFKIIAGSTPISTTESFWGGDIPWVTPADFKTRDHYVLTGRRNITKAGYDSCGTTLIPTDSVLFSKRAPVGTVCINKVPLCTNQGCLSCVPKEGASSNYFYYTMSVYTEQFELVSAGTTFKEISADSFANFILPLPPYEQQQKISDFLDKQCSKIDSVLARTRASIEEYKKLEQAVITQAVTKGIRGDRAMRDSGIIWVGNIPCDWNVEKGKHILEKLDRPTKEDDGVITCFRDGEVTLRSNRREDGFMIALKEIGYQGIDKNDLVVHGMDGFAGAIGISDSRGKGSPVLNILDSKQNKKYLMYYLRSMAYNGIFLALSTGIRIRSCDTSWNKIKNLPYILPPITEQNEIADFIDTKCAEIDKLIAKKEELIAEMENFKKSLIYECVTGKREVN